MDLEFNSLQELYERIQPALFTKCEEMRRKGYTYIKEEDVWNYLTEVKWKKSRNLMLSEMVNDVLNVDDNYIDHYLKEKLSDRNRSQYFKGDATDEEK